MIPRLFHQYWSERPLPEVYREYQASWLRHNPDWDLCMWTPGNLFELELQDRFENAAHFSHPDWLGNWRSHIVRYEALFRFGGVWIDMDMAALRPLSGLLAACESFVAMDGPTQAQTAILGAVSGHQFYRDLIDDTARMLPNPFRICASVIQVNRVLPRHPEITVLPPWTFYPIDRMTGAGELGNAYGVHCPREY